MTNSKKASETNETAVKEETMKEAASKKASAKKAAPKKTEAAEVKAEETKTAEEPAPKKAPAKKTAAKKAAAKTAEPEVTVTIQFQGKDIAAAQVAEKAKEAFAQLNPEVEVKTMDIYVKPEEGVAYYAVNGEGSGDYKVEL